MEDENERVGGKIVVCFVVKRENKDVWGIFD